MDSLGSSTSPRASPFDDHDTSLPRPSRRRELNSPDLHEPDRERERGYERDQEYSSRPRARPSRGEARGYRRDDIDWSPERGREAKARQPAERDELDDSEERLEMARPEMILFRWRSPFALFQGTMRIQMMRGRGKDTHSGLWSRSPAGSWL